MTELSLRQKKSLQQVLSHYGFPETPPRQWGKDDVNRFLDIKAKHILENRNSFEAMAENAGQESAEGLIHELGTKIALRRTQLVDTGQMDSNDQGPYSKELSEQISQTKQELRGE